MFSSIGTPIVFDMRTPIVLDMGTVLFSSIGLAILDYGTDAGDR
jgi:hypothetical protein